MFVYGTLLRGEPNHDLLAGAELNCTARTEPRFSLHDLGAFPGLTDSGDDAVFGEVYELDSETLARVDHLEGHPRFYRRRPIQLEDGSTVETYLLPAARVAGYPVIRSGSWRSHRREGQR